MSIDTGALAPRTQFRSSGNGSTQAVLWLMILLVFLPIAAAHAVLRLGGPAPVAAIARER